MEPSGIGTADLLRAAGASPQLIYPIKTSQTKQDQRTGFLFLREVIQLHLSEAGYLVTTSPPITYPTLAAGLGRASLTDFRPQNPRGVTAVWE